MKNKNENKIKWETMYEKQEREQIKHDFITCAYMAFLLITTLLIFLKYQ